MSCLLHWLRLERHSLLGCVTQLIDWYALEDTVLDGVGHP